MTYHETFDAATAGDYPAISTYLDEWATTVETFINLPYWEADYESVEDAANGMRKLASALRGDHPGDPA